MSEYIELKWNSHSSTFTKNLGSLREQQIYTDVTISCGDQFYPAHRLVLSSCSSFFEKSLEMTNCKSPVLLLYGIEQFILEHLLMFMYDGQVTVTKDDLPSFIRAAKWLGLKGLDTVANNEDCKFTGRHFQQDFPSGESECAKYFEAWRELLSPLVNSMGDPSSLDEMTTVLHQLVGRRESEKTIENLVVSNVTSLSMHEESESRFLGSSGNLESDFAYETRIKCEVSDISMEEEEILLSGPSYRPLDLGNSILDTYDSSDSDNDFEGWENSLGNFPNKLKDLQLHISQSEIHDNGDILTSSSSSELSPDHTAKDNDTDVYNKRKRPLRCKQCKLVFNIREELAEHLHSHGHNFCYECSKGFLSSRRYIMHMRLHEEGSMLYCTECTFKTHSKRGLAIHWSVMHGDDQQGDSYANKIPESVSLLICDVCGFRSNHLRGFKRHVTCMHSGKRWKELKVPQDDRVVENETSYYSCNMCDFSSNCQTGLKRHMTRKHFKVAANDTVEQEAVSQEDDSLIKYHCSICEFSSIHKRGFKKHMSCVHDKSDIVLDRQIVSSHSADTIDDSKRTLRSYSKTHECKHCNRSFESFRMLRKHEVISCGRYECRYCKKRFGAGKREEYLAHLQTHKGNEPTFSCKICSYATNRRRSLSDHMCRHTGMYRFSCQWCSFKCIRQNRLRAHMYRYHEKELSKEKIKCANVEGLENKLDLNTSTDLQALENSNCLSLQNDGDQS
ncbi:zinc finger and BTB domain-containing protein 41-like isoform X2 [Macrobrachium rosenbergii]